MRERAHSVLFFDPQTHKVFIMISAPGNLCKKTVVNPKALYALKDSLHYRCFTLVRLVRIWRRCADQTPVATRDVRKQCRIMTSCVFHITHLCNLIDSLIIIVQYSIKKELFFCNLNYMICEKKLQKENSF